MTVRIDEIVSDVGEEAPDRRGTAGAGGGGEAFAVEDLDCLDYELRRRWHRHARLWAD